MKRNSNAIKMTTGEKIFQVVNLIILILFGLSTAYPFIYFLACSFNNGSDLMRGGVYLWPRVWTLENYKTAFENKDIYTGFIVSIVRTGLGTFLSLLVTSMTGYALSYKNLPGKSAISFYFYFSGLLNGGIIPFFVLMRSLHLLNTIWVYILPSLFGYFNAVLMRTYFVSLPYELRESAMLDGANEWTIYAKIMLPLSTPMLATLALFIGVGHWNDWFAGAFYVTDHKLRPAATILQQLLTEVSTLSSTAKQTPELANNASNIDGITKGVAVTPESLRMTFVVVITLPIVCVYPFLQKYFMKGVMIGAIKG